MWEVHQPHSDLRDCDYERGHHKTHLTMQKVWSKWNLVWGIQVESRERIWCGHQQISNQYKDLEETIDTDVPGGDSPGASYDSKCGHDKVTGKSIMGNHRVHLSCSTNQVCPTSAAWNNSTDAEFPGLAVEEAGMVQLLKVNGTQGGNPIFWKIII